MSGALERLRDLRVVAVLRARGPADAVEVAEALVEGGLRAVEVTFTTPDAPSALRELRARHGDAVLLGAGTVVTAGQAEDAVEAGAEFLVSPGCDPELVPRMLATGRAVLPGVLTPSELLLALRLGVDAVKLFPASLGGPAHLRALRAPFPDVGVVPTGGVSAESAGEWLAAGALAVGVGGALAPASLEDQDRPALVARARALAEAVGAP